MISLDEMILKKYKLPLKDAFDYIGKKKPVSKRKQWTQNQREKWILRQPNCPICKQMWIENNPMTKEHIHPIVLGGQDRDDNHVPLCEKCNRARNDVMIAVLGSSSILAIRNRMPALKTSIEEFVIWCHATIIRDHQALENTKHLTQSFLHIREISDPFSITSATSTNVETRKREKRSILKRGIEFGASMLSKRTRKLSNADVPAKTIVYCVNTDCKEPMNIPNGYQGKYRCPKCKCDQSLLMESTSRPITPALRAESQAKLSAAKGDVSADYPVIQHLNSSATGLKLPREPKDFVRSVIWFVQNAMDFETFQDCTMAFKETNTLPKSRVPNNFIRIIQGITTDGDFHSIQQNSLAEDIEILLERILDNLLLKGIEMEYVDDKEQFVMHIREYFICAQKFARGSGESSAKEGKPTGKPQNLDNEISSYLQDSINKRIPAKTYQSGFTASQIGYIFKQAKEHFGISWNELFSLFDVKGTIQEKSVLIVSLLGFDIEEEIGEDEKMIYKITESKLTGKTKNASNFNLDSWLKESWKGVESYPELTKSILKFEKDRKGKSRSLRVILKEDFGIAKNRSAKNVKESLHKQYLNLKETTQKQFPLMSWIKENWQDEGSYPLLQDAILAHEEKNDGGRSLKDILKEDFDIPKSWTIAKKASYWNELQS